MSLGVAVTATMGGLAESDVGPALPGERPNGEPGSVREQRVDLPPHQIAAGAVIVNDGDTIHEAERAGFHGRIIARQGTTG